MGEAGGVNAEAGQFPEGWAVPGADESDRPPWPHPLQCLHHDPDENIQRWEPHHGDPWRASVGVQKRCRQIFQLSSEEKRACGGGGDKVMGRACARGRVLELCQLSAALLTAHYLTPALFQNYICQGDCLWIYLLRLYIKILTECNLGMKQVRKEGGIAGDPGSGSRGQWRRRCLWAGQGVTEERGGDPGSSTQGRVTNCTCTLMREHAYTHAHTSGVSSFAMSYLLPFWVTPQLLFKQTC